MAGLITRFGQWLDEKFEETATVSSVHFLFSSLENAAIKDKMELTKALQEAQEGAKSSILALENLEREFTALKDRFEKLEVYLGMSRKVDPTKPPVVRSPFDI